MTTFALHAAAEGGDIKALRNLLDGGADANEKNRTEATAIFRAVQNAHEEAVKILIDAGTDLNHKDRFGQTALHIAAKGDTVAHYKIAKLLIKSGASTSLTNRASKCPVDVATDMTRSAFEQNIVCTYRDDDDDVIYS